MNNEIGKKKKIDWVYALGWGILALAGITLCLFLQRYMTGLLDSDESSEMILSSLLAKNGGILSRDWYYSTELRVLNNQIIFSTLLRVFDSWHKARLLSNVLLYFILLTAAWGFCRSYGLRRWFPYVAAVLLMPISMVYFKIVLKGVYYIPHIAMVFATLAMLIPFSSGNKRKKWLSIVFAALLAIAAGMGGLRMLLVCYLPLMTAALGYGLAMDWKENAKPYVTFAGINLLAAGAGYLLNRGVLSRIYTFRSYESVGYTTPTAQRLFDILSGFLEDLGYKGGTLFSFAIVSCGVALGILVLAVCCAVRMIRRRELYSDAAVFLGIYYLSAIGVFALLYSFTNMTYYSQYSLPIMVLSIPVCFAGFSVQKPVKPRRISCGMILMTLAVALSGMGVYQTAKGMVNYEQADVAWYLLDSGYRNGYATFWNANVLTELTNGEIQVWDWGDQVFPDEQMNIDEMFQWLQLKSHETTHPEGNVFVLLTKAQDDQAGFRNTDAIDYVLWSSDKYVAYGFPSYEDMLNITASFHMNLANGKNLNGGTDLGAQRILYPGGESRGPGRHMPEGDYHVTVSGFDLDRAAISVVSGETELPVSNLEFDDRALSFDVTLTEPEQSMEFRVKNESDENIILTTMTVRREDK